MKSNLDCFYKIIKSVRKLSYDDLVYNLKEALSKAHKQADKDFLIWGLTCLNEKKMNSELTKEDVDFIEKYMEQTLGANIEFLSQKPFIQATIDAYGQGKKRVLHSFKMDYSLGDKDLGALQALQDFNCWWVREKVINQTNDIIQNLAKETLESGATRLQFADKLEKALLNDVKETKQYFDLLADHVLTKTQNMGHVAGYEEAGVEYVKIVAVIDEKTSEICRRMNHRIFRVSDFRKQYNKIVSAAKKHDIEGVKAAQPMVNASSFGAMPSNMRTEDFQKMGLNMPPYHFHCRTTHVAYFENEKGSVYSANKKGVWGEEIENNKEIKGFLTSYSDKELFAFINQKKDWAKNDLIKYNSGDINQDLTKHGKDFGFEIPKGRKLTQEEIKNFTSKLELYCNKTVRNAKNICINQWPETDGTLQISYYDGENIVVIGDDGTIRCAVKGNETNWLTWKKIRGRLLRGE